MRNDVHRTLVHRDDRPGGIARHPAGKCSFDGRGQQREADDRVGRPVAIVFGDEVGVLEERQFIRRRQLDVALLLAPKPRIAARSDRRQRRLAAGEIIDRNVERDDPRAAEIGERRRRLVDDVGRPKSQLLDRRPSQSRGPIGQRAEIRQPIDPCAEVERKIADRRQRVFAAARQRDAEVDAGADIAAAQMRVAAGTTGARGIDPGVREPGAQRAGDIACRETERAPDQRRARGCGIVGRRRDVAASAQLRRQRTGDDERPGTCRGDQRRGIAAAIADALGVRMRRVERGTELPRADRLVKRYTGLRRRGAAASRQSARQGTICAEVGRIGQCHRIEAGQRARGSAADRAIERKRARARRLAQCRSQHRIERKVVCRRDQRAISGQRGIAGDQRRPDSRLDHSALGLGEQAGVVGRGGQIEAAGAVDPQHARLEPLGRITTAPGNAVVELERTADEVVLEDDVHHALIGAVAKAQRDFLGQDFDLADRLGGIIAHLAEAGDALAVDQDHRKPAAPPTRGPGLGRDCGNQVGKRRGAIRLDIRLAQRGHGRLRHIDLAANTLGDDHDVGRPGVAVGRRIGGRRRGFGRRSGRNRCGCGIRRNRSK